LIRSKTLTKLLVKMPAGADSENQFFKIQKYLPI